MNLFSRVHIGSGLVARPDAQAVSALPAARSVKDGKPVSFPVVTLCTAASMRDLAKVYRKLPPSAAKVCLDAVNAVPAPTTSLDEAFHPKPARFEQGRKLTWAIPAQPGFIEPYAKSVAEVFCTSLYSMAKIAKLSHLLPNQADALEALRKGIDDKCYFLSLANQTGDPWQSIGGLTRKDFQGALGDVPLTGNPLAAFMPTSWDAEQVEKVVPRFYPELPFPFFEACDSAWLDTGRFGEYDEMIKWVAYAYKLGAYEGSGTMLCALNDGTFIFHDMGHCSCYGPMENFVVEAPFYSIRELGDRIGKDLNGKPIDPSEWNFEEMNGLWVATKAAVLYEYERTKVRSQDLEVLAEKCLESTLELS